MADAWQAAGGGAAALAEWPLPDNGSAHEIKKDRDRRRGTADPDQQGSFAGVGRDKTVALLLCLVTHPTGLRHVERKRFINKYLPMAVGSSAGC